MSGLLHILVEKTDLDAHVLVTKFLYDTCNALSLLYFIADLLNLNVILNVLLADVGLEAVVEHNPATEGSRFQGFSYNNHANPQRRGVLPRKLEEEVRALFRIDGPGVEFLGRSPGILEREPEFPLNELQAAPSLTMVWTEHFVVSRKIQLIQEVFKRFFHQGVLLVDHLKRIVQLGLEFSCIGCSTQNVVAMLGLNELKGFLDLFRAVVHDGCD
mmetsp:Transcript_24192/g.50450  ORF Transcript_24192/g.50450 Transcript_24192/m.50450 type:complete len:215 (-) Transcript_24192:4307-4951(-)